MWVGLMVALLCQIQDVLGGGVKKVSSAIVQIIGVIIAPTMSLSPLTGKWCPDIMYPNVTLDICANKWRITDHADLMRIGNVIP